VIYPESDDPLHIVYPTRGYPIDLFSIHLEADPFRVALGIDLEKVAGCAFGIGLLDG
jgi:hypothetical protein